MKLIILLTLVLSTLTPAIANDLSLQDQLSAIKSAEDQGKVNQNAERVRQEKIALEQKRKEQAAKQLAEQRRQKKIAADRAARNAAEQNRHKEALARQAETNRQNKIKQDYQQKLQELEIQRQQIELKKEAARAERMNEYIDQEINKSKAETDVIQSKADATRNISEGAKNLLDSEGKAREEQANSWF